MDLGTLFGAIGLDDSKFMGGLQSAIAGLSDFKSKGIAIAGAAGLAIASAVGVSIAKGLSIDAANDRLAAELGLTEEQSARAGKIAGQLYADNYGDSIEQVNGAIAAVIGSVDGMKDASNSAVREMAANALNFADVFEIDINRATQVAGQLMKQGLAKDGVEAFDLLTAAAQRVTPALREDVLDAVDEYGQFFKTLGYDGPQAFELLLSSTEDGMYGIDKAGDAIKEFTIRSTDMSKLTTEAFGTIGLDAQTMANDILAGGDTSQAAFQKIVDGLLDIKDPATQANTAIALFGTPLEDLNTSEIPAFLQSLKGAGDAMDGFSGAAGRMDQTLNDNASKTLQSWGRKAESAFLAVGNVFIPAIDDFVSKLNDKFGPALGDAADALSPLGDAISEVVDFMKDHETEITIIAGLLLATYIPALVAAGWAALVSGAKQAAGWLLARTGALVTVGIYAVVALLIIGYWVVMATVAMANAIRMAAAWFIALGPIGWVIGIIVALVALIIWKWDWIKAKTIEIWGKITSWLSGAWDTIKRKAGQAWDWIRTKIAEAISAAKDWVVRKGGEIIAWFTSLPGRIRAKLADARSWLVAVGSNIIQGVIDGIDKGWDWVRRKIQQLGSSILGWAKDVLGIASPSRVMRDQVGLWIPAGVAEGIEAGIPQIEEAAGLMGLAAVIPISAAPSFHGRQLAALHDQVGLPRTGTDGRQGPLVEQRIYPQPGMSEQQVGDYAGNRIVFALEGSGGL